MLDSIFRLIKSFFGSFRNFIDFFQGWIEDVAYVVKVIRDFSARIPEYFSWIPDEVNVLIGSIFAFVIVFRILGRE